jgi:acyl-CoA synthetase (NDP forming)
MDMEGNAALFERIFNPRGVAIIGASHHDIATLAHVRTKIQDRLSLINPKYPEVLGRKCYPSVLDVAGEIDYAIIGIAAATIPAVLEDCIRKGIPCAQIFTAGFAETGVPEAVARERELQRQARGRIRLIGPNCFGIYCPRSGLAIVPESPEEEGHIGVVAQSGGVAECFSYYAATKNLRFSKVISYGNAADLDGTDFLAYLADDPDTKIIALYVEGANDPDRLAAALTKAARAKPVIAIKGGMTEQGMRAAASHTASLSGSPSIWRAVIKQAGAVQVESFDEMTDAVMAFDTCPPPRGPAVAIINNSGGFSVMQTDLCLKAGIEVPRFSQETIDTMRGLIPLAGTAIGNPLDAWPIYYNVSPSGNIADIIRLVAADPHIHSLIFQFDQFRYLRRVLGHRLPDHMQRLTALMVAGCRDARQKHGMPVLAAIALDPYLEDGDDRHYNLTIKRAFAAEGFPVYANATAAIRALSHLIRFGRRF